MVLGCDGKKGALRRKDGGGNGSTMDDEENKALEEKMVEQCEGMISERRDCRGGGGGYRTELMGTYSITHRIQLGLR